MTTTAIGTVLVIEQLSGKVEFVVDGFKQFNLLNCRIAKLTSYYYELVLVVTMKWLLTTFKCNLSANGDSSKT